MLAHDARLTVRHPTMIEPHDPPELPLSLAIVDSLEPLAVITKSIPVTKLRLLSGGLFAVISKWDERCPVSKRVSKRCFLRNPKLRAWISVMSITVQTFVRSDSVVARVVAGETLIVPVRAKVGDLASIYSFNGTGTLIWKLLESPRTVSELASAVVSEYEVDQATAMRDVTDFVREMKGVGLVEVPAPMAMAGD